MIKGMIIGLDMGHTLQGADYGAVGILEESECTREIGNEFKKKAEALGHKVIVCSIDGGAKDLNDSLSKRVANANRQYLDLFLSIHLNSGGGTGVETYCVAKGGKAEQYANKIQNAMVKLGYKDRGAKTANFYVLRKTNAPAVLVECGFVDSKEDCNLYNPDKIAGALVEAIAGETVKPQGQPYRQRLQVMNDIWSYNPKTLEPVKKFVAGDHITAIGIKSGWYVLDIDGKEAWIPSTPCKKIN